MRFVFIGRQSFGITGDLPSPAQVKSEESYDDEFGFVAGGGVLVAQIAFQAAVHGFSLFVYDLNDSALEAGRPQTGSVEGGL
jgi:hypothetical protein